MKSKYEHQLRQVAIDGLTEDMVTLRHKFHKAEIGKKEYDDGDACLMGLADDLRSQRLSPYQYLAIIEAVGSTAEIVKLWSSFSKDGKLHVDDAQLDDWRNRYQGKVRPLTQNI